jgi:hypothetical protein
VGYSNKSLLTTHQKIALFAYALASIIAVGYALLVAALGDCAPKIDGSGCEFDGLIRFLFFPGSLIISVIGGFVLVRYMMKDSS